MGDHRMSIKIQAEFHGKKKSTDMWINWWPESESGIDQRIVDFFKELEAEGMAVFDKTMEKVRKQAIEDEEKKELIRLKEKYE